MQDWLTAYIQGQFLCLSLKYGHRITRILEDHADRELFGFFLTF